jgi:SAM-dependent methyltransferase
VLSEFVQHRHARVLDIGCADGGLLSLLSETSTCELWGIDPSPACVERTARIAGVSARIGSLFDMPGDLPPMDIVILSHVIEHVRDVKSGLARLGDRLAPDAVIYVEVPDAERYVDYLTVPFQEFNTEHINHFSTVALTNALRLSGLDLVRIGRKELTPSPGTRYPAIFAVARQALSRGDSEVIRDVQLRGRLDAYVRRSTTMMRALDAQLRAVLVAHPEVVVWGTGELLAKLLVDTALASARIVAFVDANPVNHGRVIGGRPVVGPEMLDSSTIPIVVTSILHAAAIAQTIRARGLRNPIVRLDQLRDDAAEVEP